MIANGSVPAGTLLPHIVYRDIPEAIAWLATPPKLGFGTESLTVFVDNRPRS